MKLKRIAAMLTAAVMAVSLAACGGNTGTNTESSQNPKENAEAQAVHLNLAESWGFEYFYTILTPEVSSSSYDITYYLTSFYDTLFEYNSEGEVVGVLAEDWSMSEDGLTIFKTQGGYYDPAMVITNINPSTSMDPILMQIGASQPELAALVDELDSATDEARIQEIYNTILTTMADQCLTTPLIYTRQLAIYSDAVASYTFPTDASFTSVQNIHLN